jgi:hypothetical protein
MPHSRTSPPPYLARLPGFWQAQFVGWLAFSALTLPLKQLAYESLHVSLLITAYQLPLALALTGLLRLVYQRTRPHERSFWTGAALVLGTCALAGLIDLAVSQPANAAIGAADTGKLTAPALLVFRGTIYLVWSLGYFLIKAQLASRQQAFQTAIADEQLRLQSLRYQLNPRFLASSLAAITDEIDADPAMARAMTLRLTNFYHTTLQQAERDTATTVRDEFELIRAYLGIESLRLGPALTVNYQVDDRLLDQPLPPLLVLPLAEQAVQQGRQALPKPFAIKVTAQLTPTNQMLIEVAHTGRLTGQVEPGGLPESDLLNLRARLSRHYADRHHFVLTQDSTRVRATLTLPAVSP